jgi:phytoene synthase
MAAALSPLAAELRAAVPERFLTCLFAPAAVREAMMALAAFEAATAKATLATQALAGLGRLAFWRDAVAAAGDGRTLSHPVADALRAAIVAHRLPASLFETHLAAREAMLAQGAFPDMAALCAHARDLAAPILSLGCRVLDRPAPPATDWAGTALGLVALLQHAIRLARVGRLALPAEACSAAGFGVQSLAEGRNRDRVARVVETVSEAALAALAEVRVPRAVAVAFLPLVPARFVLGALERQKFDPAAAALWQPGTATRLAVLWAALRGSP